MRTTLQQLIACCGLAIVGVCLPVTLLAAELAAEPEPDSSRRVSAPPPVVSSWDDLLAGVQTAEQWHEHKEQLRKRFLALIRDEQKPERPPLDLQVHAEVTVAGLYRRQLISYQVEADERAHAYLGIPLDVPLPAPAVVVLHGTFAQGKDQAAGLVDDPSKAYLDHVCRRGYVAIAPEHFVSGHRIPPEGPYDTKRFYEKHPEWTAVGKFTYEHSIAVDLLASLAEVDSQRIGVLGHSLGGQGTTFLAAYDQRIKVAISNCSAAMFRHNPGVEHWARGRWYVYLKHIRPAVLAGNLPPIDFHEIMALTAPRAQLDISATNDGDPAIQKQRVLMLMKVAEAYELEGAPENFGYYVHGQGHAVPHASRALMYAWLDQHLKPASETTPRLVEPPE